MRGFATAKYSNVFSKIQYLKIWLYDNIDMFIYLTMIFN
jgi:hypothetical protein